MKVVPVSVLGSLFVLLSVSALQPPAHPGAEKALAEIVLDQDFGEELRFHSREVVTTTKNDAVTGLNGLMFMRWKGDQGASEVTASVQWFAEREDLLRFCADSTKRADISVANVNGMVLWKIGRNGYMWTDAKHFFVSLGGQPAPPPKMLEAWLDLISSNVKQVVPRPAAGGEDRPVEDLGHGYSRRGDFIYYNRVRIDQAGAHDIDAFARAVGYKLTLCRDLDAESFEALSTNYSRDRKGVYFKWISPGRFWVVEIPGADPRTFEVLGLDLAKDKNQVWIDDRPVKDADASTARSLFGSRIWLDKDHVRSRFRIIAGADPGTFERIGTSEFGYYRDARRVYKYFGMLKVVEGADPATFQLPQKN